MHETYDAGILVKLAQSAAPPAIGPRLASWAAVSWRAGRRQGLNQMLEGTGAENAELKKELLEIMLLRLKLNDRQDQPMRQPIDQRTEQHRRLLALTVNGIAFGMKSTG